MGVFIYDSAVRAVFDDVALAHLQLVITAKLRRGEAFAFSWAKQAPETGRATVWLNGQIPLLFDFDIEEMPTISRAWIEQLTHSANSSLGLRLTPHPTDPAVELTSETQVLTPHRDTADA